MDSAKNHRSDFLPFRGTLHAGAAESESSVLRTFCNPDELEALRLYWQYWPGTRDSDLEFLLSVVRSRSGCQPYVIALFRNAKLDAILVGLRERRKLSYKLGWFRICEFEINVLEFVSGGLRGCASEENCAAFVQHVMRSLKKGDADIASWKDLDVKSLLCRHVLRWPHFALKDHFQRIDGHWWITNLPDSLNSFFMTRKRRQRSTLRHKHNHVLKHFAGTIRIRCFRSVADLELAIRDIEAIASKAKRRLFGLGFVDTPECREQILATAQKGWLRIYILYLGDKPVAFWKGILYGECLQGDHVGYDPAWSKLSPGIFLFLNMIEDLRKDGVKTVDLGFGDTQFKKDLGNLRCVESQVSIYAPTLRGILLNLLNLSCARVNDSLRFLLHHTSYLEWVRTTRRKRLELLNSRRISQVSVKAPDLLGKSLDSSK